MKKILLVGLILGLVFAGNPNIRPGNSGGVKSEAYQSLWMEVKGKPAYAGVTPSALVWYADNIAGYSRIDFYGMAVSTGSVPTTISAQPIYANGASIGTAQTITSGTDLTDIRSSFYKFTLPAASVTRNVSFNFLIAD